MVKAGWVPHCFGSYQGVGDQSCFGCRYNEERACEKLAEKRNYPHDADCEGTMCYCASRAKRADPEKYERLCGAKK
jgi:hypothetical protein